MCKGLLSICKTKYYYSGEDYDGDELPFPVPQIQKEANYSMEMYEYHRRTTFEISVQLLEYLFHMGWDNWLMEFIMDKQFYSIKHYELFYQYLFSSCHPFHSREETLDEIIESLENSFDLNPLFVIFVFQSSYLRNYIQVEHDGLEEWLIYELSKKFMAHIGRKYIHTFKNKEGTSALDLFYACHSKRSVRDMFYKIGKNYYHLDKKNILLLERIKSCIKK